MFDAFFKKNNCEIFVSDVNLIECPLENDATYVRSVNEKGYSIRTLNNQKLGFSSSNIFDKFNIKKTFENSILSSKQATKIPSSFSFTDSFEKTNVSKNYDEKIVKNMGDFAIDLANECIQSAEEHNVSLTTGKVSFSVFEYTIKNSLGVEKKEKCTNVLILMDSKAITQKPLSELSSSYSKRMYDKSEAISWFNERMNLTNKFINPGKIKSGTYPLILNPSVVAPLINETIGYWASGKSIVDDFSPFKNNKGVQIANEKLTIVNDPTHPNTPSTFGIDYEGTKTKKTEIIKNGIFSNYFYDNKYASHFGVKSTGNASKVSPGGIESIYHSPSFCGLQNVVLNSGSCSKDEMLSDFNGLLVESVGLPDADSETGNFGFELRNAFLVEKGELKPVRYGVYSGTVQTLMKNISMLSKERNIVPDSMAPDYGTSSVCPYFLLENQKISADK